MEVRRIIVVLLLVGLIAFVGAYLLRSLTLNRYSSRILTAPQPDAEYRTAVVFGAAVRGNRPTTILRDRLDTAIALYHDGIVDRLVMSGDGQYPSYDEPGVMARYAISHGVPEAAIVIDRFGLRTYDTCYRLRHVYGVDRAILVSQGFHLPRALFVCEFVGVEAIGMSADKREYRSARWYTFREFFALVVATWDVVRRPVPEGIEIP